MLTRDQRLVAIAIQSVKYEQAIGYPPQVLIAQWAIESKWGAKPSGRNNLFGMTYNPARHSAFSWVATWEELNEAGISALSPDELRTVTKREALPHRNGWWRIELQRKFADYASQQASIDDKVGLITRSPRYQAAWSAFLRDRDINALLVGICAAGYATASYYPQLAQQIAAQPNVARAIAAARAAAGQKSQPNQERT